MSFKQELIKKFNRSIFENAKMSNYSWFNLGGPAEYLFKPENDEQLIEFLEENKINVIRNLFNHSIILTHCNSRTNNVDR